MISKAVGYAGQGVGLVGKGVSLVGKGIKGVFTGKDYRPILPIPRHEELKKYPPPTFHINLDLPPKERWAEVIAHFKPALQDFRKHFKYILPYNAIHFVLSKFYSHDHLDEMRAIAELAEVEFNLLYTVNLVYETATRCTSIVLRTEDGKIIHGYNMDFGLQKFIANLTFKGTFHKNGQVLYQANAVAGSVGMPNGVKPGKFSITLNERYHGFLGLKNMYYILFKGGCEPLQLIREVLEKANSFEEAVKMVSETKLIAPGFFTISGPDDGVIVTRSHGGVEEKTWLGSTQKDENNWFIVQTNYDRKTGDPKFDTRRGPAESKLSAIGPKAINPKVLADEILAEYPNFISKTIWTAVMTPQTGGFDITMWY